MRGAACAAVPDTPSTDGTGCLTRRRLEVMMHGTHFAQFSTEALHRGAAAVLPQHLPDCWLDALLEEADLLAPGERGREGRRPRRRLLCGPPGRRALVVLMDQGGHPPRWSGRKTPTPATICTAISSPSPPNVSVVTRRSGSNHRHSRTCLTRSARCRRGGVHRAHPQRARAGGSRALPQAGSTSARYPLPWPRHTAAAAMTTAARVLPSRSYPHALGKRGRTGRGGRAVARGTAVACVLGKQWEGRKQGPTAMTRDDVVRFAMADTTAAVHTTPPPQAARCPGWTTKRFWLCWSA